MRRSRYICGYIGKGEVQKWAGEEDDAGYA